MRMTMQLASIAAVVLIGALAPTPASAQKLWSEKSSATRAVTVAPDFAKLAAEVVPAVVSIQVEQKVKMAGRGRHYGDPFEFFFRPFGGEVPHEFRNRGLGTGFVISQQGLIITNYHVVEHADSIEVTFTLEDGTERKMTAKVLGSAPEYDVALIKTDGNARAPVTFLGDSDKIRIGDWVLAIGNPFGLSHSVSVGIIPAKERRNIMPSGRRGLYDFLQTDASINPGNSGGPLVNTRGEVIGINSAINAAGAGIGFAIPINMVKQMLPDLKSKGKYRRSWIGIKIQPLDEDLAQSYGLKRPTGALVSEVVDDSPAAKAGILDGDIVLEFDGKKVRTSSDLPLYASMAGIGKKVSLKILRSGHEISMPIELSEFPGAEQKLAEAPEAAEGSLGVTVADITPSLRQQFDLPRSHGVIIKEVEPHSPAARAGLRPGDLVLSMNGRRMSNARNFARAVRTLKSGGVMRIQIARRGGRLYVAMRKP